MEHDRDYSYYALSEAFANLFSCDLEECSALVFHSSQWRWSAVSRLGRCGLLWSVKLGGTLNDHNLKIKSVLSRSHLEMLNVNELEAYRLTLKHL